MAKHLQSSKTNAENYTLSLPSYLVLALLFKPCTHILFSPINQIQILLIIYFKQMGHFLHTSSYSNQHVLILYPYDTSYIHTLFLPD